MEVNIEDYETVDVHLKFLNNKLQKENYFRKEIKFSDVSLKINNKDLFKVHKTIIASSCEYFTGLFNGDWKETREDVISLDYEINPEYFEILLDYMYTGKLGITKISYEKGLILHKAALFFNLLDLKNIMSQILQKFITLETVLVLWRHGVKYLDDPLRDKCVEVITKNSINFLNQNLHELTFEELKILRENKILKCPEDKIYENFIQWIKTDFISREKYLKQLLDLVDFSKIYRKVFKKTIIINKILYIFFFLFLIIFMYLISKSV